MLYALLLVLLLGGCATQAGMEQAMHSWDNGNINDFIAKAGPPAQVYDMPNGNRMFVFGRSSSYTTPTYTSPTTITANTSINRYGNTSYGTINAQVYGGQVYGGQTFNSSCTIRLTVNPSDTIITWAYEGNACRFRPRNLSAANPEQTSANGNSLPAESKLSAFNVDPLIKAIQKGNYSSDGVSLRAPDVAENGEVVPLEITTALPLVEGEKLYVIENDEYVSHVVTPTGHIKVVNFSIRVLMPASGYVRGVILDKSGKIRAASKEVQVNVGATANNSGLDSAFLHKVRTINNNGNAEIKLLIKSPMASANYLRELTIRYGDYGSVLVKLTPAATKNPYIGITTSLSGAYSQYELLFYLSDGKQFTDSGVF